MKFALGERVRVLSPAWNKRIWGWEGTVIRVADELAKGFGVEDGTVVQFSRPIGDIREDDSLLFEVLGDRVAFLWDGELEPLDD